MDFRKNLAETDKIHSCSRNKSGWSVDPEFRHCCNDHVDKSDTTQKTRELQSCRQSPTSVKTTSAGAGGIQAPDHANDDNIHVCRDTQTGCSVDPGSGNCCQQQNTSIKIKKRKSPFSDIQNLGSKRASYGGLKAGQVSDITESLHADGDIQDGSSVDTGIWHCYAHEVTPKEKYNESQLPQIEELGIITTREFDVDAGVDTVQVNKLLTYRDSQDGTSVDSGYGLNYIHESKAKVPETESHPSLNKQVTSSVSDFDVDAGIEFSQDDKLQPFRNESHLSLNKQESVISSVSDFDVDAGIEFFQDDELQPFRDESHPSLNKQEPVTSSVSEFDFDAGKQIFQDDKLHAFRNAQDGASADLGFEQKCLLENTAAGDFESSSLDVQKPSSDRASIFDNDADIECLKFDKVYDHLSVDKRYEKNYMHDNTSQVKDNESRSSNKPDTGTHTARDLDTFQACKSHEYENAQNVTAGDTGHVNEDTHKEVEVESQSLDIQGPETSTTRGLDVDAGIEPFQLDMLHAYKGAQNETSVGLGHGKIYVTEDKLPRKTEGISLVQQEPVTSTTRDVEEEAGLETVHDDTYAQDGTPEGSGNGKNYIHKDTPKVKENTSSFTNIQDTGTDTARDVHSFKVDKLHSYRNAKEYGQNYFLEDSLKLKESESPLFDKQDSGTNVDRDFDVDTVIETFIIDTLNECSYTLSNTSVHDGHGQSYVQKNPTEKENESNLSDMQELGQSAGKSNYTSDDVGLETFQVDKLHADKGTQDGTSEDPVKCLTCFHESIPKVQGNKSPSSVVQHPGIIAARDIETFEVDKLPVFEKAKNNTSVFSGHKQNFDIEDTKVKDNRSPSMDIQKTGTNTDRNLDGDAGSTTFNLDMLNDCRNTLYSSSPVPKNVESYVHTEISMTDIMETEISSSDTQDADTITAREFDVDTGIGAYISDMLKECRDTVKGSAVDSVYEQSYILKDTTEIKENKCPSPGMKSLGTCAARSFYEDARIISSQVDKFHAQSDVKDDDSVDSGLEQNFMLEDKPNTGENVSPSSVIQDPVSSKGKDFDVDAGIETYILGMLNECQDSLNGTSVDSSYGQSCVNEYSIKGKENKPLSPGMKDMRSARQLKEDAQIDTSQVAKLHSPCKTKDGISVDSSHKQNFILKNNPTVNKSENPSPDKHDPGTGIVKDFDVDSGIETYILDMLNECRDTLKGKSVDSDYDQTCIHKDIKEGKENETSISGMKFPSTCAIRSFDEDARINTFQVDKLHSQKDATDVNSGDNVHKHNDLLEDKLPVNESPSSGIQDPHTSTVRDSKIDESIEKFILDLLYECRNKLSRYVLGPGIGQINVQEDWTKVKEIKTPLSDMQKTGTKDTSTQKEEDNSACRLTPYPNDESIQQTCSFSGNLKESSFLKSTSDGSKKQAVKFSDDISVETYTDREPEHHEQASSASAFGDGPSSGHEILSTTTNYRSSLPDGKPLEKPPLKKMENIGATFSPTDILRKKQKQAADTIMKSVSEKPTSPGEFRKTKVVSHKLDYKDVPLRHMKHEEESRVKTLSNTSKVSESAYSLQINKFQPYVQGETNEKTKGMSDDRPVNSDELRNPNVVSHKLNKKVSPSKQKAGKDKEESRLENSNNTRSVPERSNAKEIKKCIQNATVKSDDTDNHLKNNSVMQGGSDENVVCHNMDHKGSPSKQKAEEKDKKEGSLNDTRSVSQFHMKKMNDCQPNIPGAPGVKSKTVKNMFEKQTDSDEFKQIKMVSHEKYVRDVESQKKARKDKKEEQPALVSRYSICENTDVSVDSQTPVNSAECKPIVAGVSRQGRTRKHKRIAERQNSRKPVLTKRYSGKEETDSSYALQPSVTDTEGGKAGEKEDTTLLIQNIDKRQHEEKQLLSQSYRCTSQGNFKDIVNDRVKNVENSPDTGSFDYSTLSVLLRKCTDRQRNEEIGPGYGAFCYTTPSELFLKTENADKITQKDDTTNEGKMCNDKDASKVGGEKADSHEEQRKEEVANEEEKHSEKKEIIVENSRILETGKNNKVSQEEGFVPHERHETNLELPSRLFLEDSVGRTNASDDEFINAEINEIPVVLDAMNNMVSQFLGMLSMKNQNGLPITTDDYRELSLIQSAIEVIISKLTAAFVCVESHCIPSDSIKDQDNLANVKNLRSNIAMVTAAKDKIRNILQSPNIPALNGKEQTNSKPEKIIIEDKENVQRQPSIDEVFWAVEEKYKTRTTKSSNIMSAGGSPSGYLEDVSTDTCNERKTSRSRLSFSNDYDDEQTMIAETRNVPYMFGSEMMPQSSISIKKDLWSVTSTHGSAVDTVICRHSSQCDCFECNKQWLYWNKRLENDPDAIEDIEQDSERLDSSRLAFMKARLHGTPYPSHFSLTANPSFAWSDEECDTNQRLSLTTNPSFAWLDEEDNIDKSYQVGISLTTTTNPSFAWSDEEDDIDKPYPVGISLTINPSFAWSDEEDDTDIPIPICLPLTTNHSFAWSEEKNDTDDKDGTKVIADGTSLHHHDVESLAATNLSAASEDKVAPASPQKEINMITRLTFPDDTSSVQVELGASRFMLSTEEGLMQQNSDYKEQQICDDAETYSQQEGSPDRSQKLYGSSHNLERRGESGLAKRKQAGRSLTPDSRLMMDKEVLETQNRKLQTEISTLQTENKLLKEKHNRSQARISELEEQLSEAQDDVASLQESLNREVSGLKSRTQTEIDRGRDDLQARVISLTKQNETLKSEIASLEKQVEGSNRTIDMVRHNTEKTRTLEAHKMEITALKEELGRVKALLDQSERHLREEEERHAGVAAQVVRLTELKNALQQQQGADSTGTVGDKQLKSLEKRLHVTEERLHQERADRANNLSAVEDKLLTENARLQAVEKDLTRQLHREKEKNRNLDHRVKQVREENEKLRLTIPFDDAKLLEDKQNYDIPYSSHSNQRAETMKHISDDMNYILSQIEKQDGLTTGTSGQEEVIRTLWNKRELAYQQLREFELNFEELHLNDNNILDGLKNLRDTYEQAESKLKGMEEQVTDAHAQMATLETTYKEQLSMLVHERHDALARLKTAEDILEATRAENELLRQNVHVVQAGEGGRLSNGVPGSSEALQMEIANLESKLAQLTRTNQKLDGELGTTRTQVDARNKALQDVQSELDLAYSRLKGTDCDDRMQNKIDKLSTEVSGLQVELKMMTDKYNSAVSEKSRLETELAELRKHADTLRAKQQKSGHAESKVQQQLKDEISEKESRLTGVTKQLEETEKELNKHQQDLYIEQMHNSELEAEVEALRVTVEQRAQMFESLSGTEREQLAQYTLLKDTLDTLNQELAQKHAQIISLDVNLSSQKDRTAELEAEVEQLRANRDPEEESSFTVEEQRSAHQLRITELEKERSQIKQELVQAYNAIKAAEEQYRTLQSESAQLEQELVKEKTVILQITAEKGEVEQHLEELAEEHDSLIQEKNQAEEDLIRLETKLQEILQKYETEAKKNHADFTRDYPNLPPEARKLVSELDSLRLLVDGKDREIGMLQDKINRQQIDIEFLNRKVELVHNDSISNREDVARMIQELTLKMKEAVSTREVNQFLVGERTKLQNEKLHLETELERERQTNDKQKHEIAEVVRKVQGTESRQKTVEKESKAQANLISTLQSDLQASQESSSAAESEIKQLQAQLEKQDEELRSLRETRVTVEEQLVAERNTLSEERNALSKLREELNRLSHDHELLQHEHTMLSDKHKADVQSIEHLRSELDARQKEQLSLQEELHSTRLDLEGQKGQLLVTKDTVQKLNLDKGTIYQDYEGMCRTVTEKERQLMELRHQSQEKMEHLKQLHQQEKSHLEQTMSEADHERDYLRRELESVKEQLEMKDIQLNTFGKTLQELEETKSKKNLLEAQLHKLESSSGDSRLLLEGQRKELVALNEALAKQQERSNRIEAENHTLKADLKSQKQNLNREIHELSLSLKELKSQHENERHFLNDNLAKTQTQLRTVEASLVTAYGERDTLRAQHRVSQAQLEEVETKHSDEATARRLAEQSIGHLRLQLEDMRNEKNTMEAHYTEMKSQLEKVEDQLKDEKTNRQKMCGRIQELQAVSHTTDTANRVKNDQIETLQAETSRLRQMIESQKQNLTGKMKKASLEFKQQLDRVQEDRDKLVVQVQKISTDLEACREQLAQKNKQNLKLQEDNLVLEDSVRESKTRQKQAEETLKAETEKLSSMANRFLEQDEELKRLRNFLAKKAEDSGEADKSMWQEMNRVIQELSRQMHEHLDAQKSEGKDTPSHQQVMLRYKKQLAELQGELGTEKSLHQITRTSLQALEEDCQRLRHQLHAMRRRDPQATQKKYKNKMEAINAIIARSQSQAQALLASGGYLDPAVNSPRVPMSARPGYDMGESPDNSYSEDLSIASLPPLHYGAKLQK